MYQLLDKFEVDDNESRENCNNYQDADPADIPWAVSLSLVDKRSIIELDSTTEYTDASENV